MGIKTPCSLSGFDKYLIQNELNKVQHRNTICFMVGMCAGEERAESISQFNSVSFVNVTRKDIRRHLHSTAFLFNQTIPELDLTIILAKMLNRPFLVSNG